VLTFDVFVCGTVLDHLADLPVAAAALRRLANPGAILVAWNGLNDAPSIVARHGVAVFRELVSYRSVWLGLAGYAAYGVLRLPRLLREMQRRQAQPGVPFDHHRRWFTAATTADLLAPFGELLDLTVLPQTQHSFATIRLT
jgi:hypothetical protein